MPSVGKHHGYTANPTSENTEKTYIAIYNFKPMAEGDLQLFKVRLYFQFLFLKLLSNLAYKWSA